MAWVRALPGRAVFVAYPATDDFLFVYWYLIRFAGESPFSHAGLDIKTFAMALLGTRYRDTVKRRLPARWRVEPEQPHVALCDAIAQGELFFRMLAERPRRPSG